MPDYMLCYSSGYDHLKEPFRRLMEALGFESVTVFDHPEFGPLSDGILDRITEANGLVVLLGPSRRPDGGTKESEPATWPQTEATIAVGQRKPIALFVHDGCNLSQLLASDQVAARFDFWEADSFQQNVHHIVKYLRDLKRRVDNIEVDRQQPFHYRKASLRNFIQGDGSMVVQYSHEAVVQEPRGTFAHHLNTAGDTSTTAKFPVTDDIECQIILKADGVSRDATIQWGECTDFSRKYLVLVDPPLHAGEELVYTRRFRFPNSRFPLTRQDLAERAKQPGFPEFFGSSNYGDRFFVGAKIEELTVAFHFPPNVRVRSYKPLVVVVQAGAAATENKAETEACQRLVRKIQNAETMETTVSLTVENPLPNNHYYLLYEPDA